MKKFTVTVSFAFEISAEDWEEAEKIVDGAFSCYVDNPQTGKRIKPEMDVEENWWEEKK